MSTRTPKSAGSKSRRAKTPAKTAAKTARTRSVSSVRGQVMQSLPAVFLRAIEKPQTLLVPGAAALGAGALATTGLLLRQQLAHLLRSAAEGAVSRASAAADGASLRALLEHAGLTRKRTLVSFLSARGPWIGLAAGVIAAGAATAFLVPSAKRLVRDKRAHVNGVVEPLKASASPITPASGAHAAS